MSLSPLNSSTSWLEDPFISLGSQFPPTGPSTAHLRTLVPKAMPGMDFGARVPAKGVQRSFGFYSPIWALLHILGALRFESPFASNRLSLRIPCIRSSVEVIVESLYGIPRPSLMAMKASIMGPTVGSKLVQRCWLSGPCGC